MATKSEIWEAKKLIKSGVEDIMEHLQRKTNWASRAVILRAFEGIKRTISPIITHIIDNDDYTTAVEINSIITPVIDGYFGNEPSEADFDREPEKNILRAENRSAYDFRDLVMDLRNWISEYEKQPHETQQVEQTQHHETKETEKTNSEISQSELKELFIPVFFADDFKTQETATETKRLSRYDVFLQRLELLLNDTDRKLTNKDIGGVAILIYQSKFASMDYRQPSSKKFRGKFSALLKIVFNALGKPLPSETSPNKYQPSEHISDLFSDIFR